MPRTVWQITGGPPNRSYADLFVRHGVALLGPGDAGAWRPECRDAEFGGHTVRRFAADVRPDDAVLLRNGPTSISAVGLFAGDYQHLPQFDDVNGWDLQHARRVRWYPIPDGYNFGAPVFGASPARFAKVRRGEVVRYTERFLASPPIQWQTAPLPSLPAEEPGLAQVPERLAGLVSQAQDLARLYNEGEAFGDLPTEDEMVAHYVIPLLRALGWSVERIAVKWRDVDVSIFRALPRRPESCHFIIEAKRLGGGVEGALRQAQGYLAKLGIQRDVVVTDGIRYRLYAADLDFEPVAYANLIRLKVSATALFERMRRP